MNVATSAVILGGIILLLFSWFFSALLHHPPFGKTPRADRTMAFILGWFCSTTGLAGAAILTVTLS